MTATNHALTGAAIAILVKRPELAVPAAFLSHFAIDLVPHFNARKLPKRWILPFIGVDLTLGNLLAVLLPLLLVTSASAWSIFFCMVAAMSPDYVWCWRYFQVRDSDKTFAGSMSWFSIFHMRIQWSDSLEGGFVELVWLGFVIWLIVTLH